MIIEVFNIEDINIIILFYCFYFQEVWEVVLWSLIIKDVFYWFILKFFCRQIIYFCFNQKFYMIVSVFFLNVSNIEFYQFL